MPFYENKYNNLMFLIGLLKLCFSYYEQFQLFGLCQFILWDILYLVTVGLWKRKQGKHANMPYFSIPLFVLKHCLVYINITQLFTNNFS